MYGRIDVIQNSITKIPLRTLNITISLPPNADLWLEETLTPSLDLAFSRGVRTSQHNACLIDQWMSHLFPQPGKDIPVSVLLASDFPENSAHTHYICCELVQYTAGMNDVFLRKLPAAKHMGKTIQSYMTLIEKHIEDSTLHHVPQWPNLMILGCKTPLRINTTSLARAQHKPLSDVLPTGEDARQWISTMNEIQMIFHQHNEKANPTEAEEKPNGVWFWGEGSRQRIERSKLWLSTNQSELSALSRAANATMKTQSEIINEKTAEFDALIDVNITDHRDLLEADDLVLRSFNSLKNSLYSRLSVTLIRNNTAHTTVCSKYSQYKLWKQRQRVKTWVGHDGI